MCVDRTFMQPLRQSNISACLHCPRYYMYRYRWGLEQKGIRKQGAKGLGSITHRLLQLGPDGEAQVRQEIEEQKEKLSASIEAGEDIFGEASKALQELSQQYAKAVAICRVLWEKHPRSAALVSLVAEEEFLTDVMLDGKVTTVIAGRLDEIFLNKETRRLWVRDYKTTSRAIEGTIAGYAWSLQCRLYRLLAHLYFLDLISCEEYLQDVKDSGKSNPNLDRRLETLKILKDYNIEDTSPSGFVLDVIKTPTIVMGQQDRDYILYDHTITRGPRKGEVEKRKEYTGEEPVFENYLERVKQWYEEQEVKPVRSFSIMYNEDVLNDELKHALKLVTYYMQMEPVPPNFRRDVTRARCNYYDRVCEYYDLCNSDESRWPAVIAEKYEQVEPDVDLTPRDAEPQEGESNE